MTDVDTYKAFSVQLDRAKKMNLELHTTGTDISIRFRAARANVEPTVEALAAFLDGMEFSELIG